MRCASCGANPPEDAKLCSECGADVRSARGPEAERKVITGLFCDVVGSTNLGERLDPEEENPLLESLTCPRTNCRCATLRLEVPGKGRTEAQKDQPSCDVAGHGPTMSTRSSIRRLRRWL